MRQVTVAEEIEQVRVKRPHVVVLGAGASVAACPNGDKNGNRLPVMSNLVETLALTDLIPSRFHDANFEETYSALASDSTEGARVRQIEDRVYDYFSSLVLPNGPTIYDHLVLSLQQKDVIATFNWDPLLIQALRRHEALLREFGAPTILCLHGNVFEAHCQNDLTLGTTGTACSKCGRLLTPSRLLYPVSEKDYSNDVFLNDSWKQLAKAFRTAFMVTIFGYGAPTSDRGAVALLKDAWGKWEDRDMEQFEIIDIREEEDLVVSWKPFIHSHHYSVRGKFWESSLTLHPRRTGEDWQNRYVDNVMTTPNCPPRDSSLANLRKWHRPLVDAERRGISAAR
jgi:hypothetical protein